jgi:ApaG protein
LRERHWKITDAGGHTQEVKGEGVIGQKPVLKPGQIYSYTSGAPLGTPWGMMVGSYTMQASGGETFRVGIPAFSLDSPHQKAAIH